MPENDNAHDRNAVAVYIGESKVGYLSRDKAASYRIGARDKKGHLLTKAECEAVVVGGWDRGDGDAGHYGVRLDILWPPQFAYR